MMRSRCARRSGLSLSRLLVAIVLFSVSIAGAGRAPVQPSADAAYQMLAQRVVVPVALEQAYGRLERSSPHLVGHFDDHRVRALVSDLLGGIELTVAPNPQDVLAATMRFLSEHAQLFGLPADRLVAGDTVPAGFRVVEMRRSGGHRVLLQQSERGLPVFDARFALQFDDRGRLRSLWGAPAAVAVLAPLATVRIGIEDAIRRATAAVSINPGGTLGTLQGQAELGFLAGSARLVWRARTTAKNGPTVDETVTVDAGNGAIVSQDSNIDANSRTIPIRRYKHTGGVRNDAPGAENPLTDDRSITIDTVTEIEGECTVRLQRLGSGRARMWNARLNTDGTDDPRFGYSSTSGPCDRLDTLSYFVQSPQSSVPLVSDGSWKFNEHAYAARKLDQSAARKVIHLRAVHSTLF